MNTALAVIDVQTYFLQRSPKDMPQRIADHIERSNYDLILFTTFKNREGSNWELSLGWKKCQNEEDVKIAKELQKYSSSNNLFTKATYSAFKAEGFEGLLKAHKIDRLELCGIDLEACVLATAYEAFDKGYEVKVLFDLSHSRAGYEEAAKSIILRDLQTKNDSGSH